MKSKTGELSVRTDEIDLYGELATYAQLSPEEQEARAMEMSKAEETEPAATPEPSFERAHELSPPEVECIESAPPDMSPGLSPDMGSATDSALQVKIEQVPARMGTGDLLSAFASFTDGALPPNSVRSQTSACPACGCESDSDDLFCVACGAFIDEPAALELPADPARAMPLADLACTDCGENITPDEIFCPSCGVVL